MVDIRKRMTQASRDEITNVLSDLKANVGLFGGRFYTYNKEFKGHAVTGELSLKEIISLTQKHYKTKADGSLSGLPLGLGRKIIELHESGEKELQNASDLQRFLTAIRRFFGNFNFDKGNVLIAFSKFYNEGHVSQRQHPHTSYAGREFESKRTEAQSKNGQANEQTLQSFKGLLKQFNPQLSNGIFEQIPLGTFVTGLTAAFENNEKKLEKVSQLKKVIRELPVDDFKHLMRELITQHKFKIFVAFFDAEKDMPLLVSFFPLIDSNDLVDLNEILTPRFFKIYAEYLTSKPADESESKRQAEVSPFSLQSCIYNLIKHLAYIRSRSSKILELETFSEMNKTINLLIQNALNIIGDNLDIKRDFFETVLRNYHIEVSNSFGKEYIKKIYEDIENLVKLFNANSDQSKIVEFGSFVSDYASYLIEHRIYPHITSQSDYSPSSFNASLPGFTTSPPPKRAASLKINAAGSPLYTGTKIVSSPLKKNLILPISIIILLIKYTSSLCADEITSIIKISDEESIKFVFDLLEYKHKIECLPYISARELISLYVCMSDQDRQGLIPSLKEALHKNLNANLERTRDDATSSKTHLRSHLAMSFRRLSIDQQTSLFPNGIQDMLPLGY